MSTTQPAPAVGPYARGAGRFAHDRRHRRSSCGGRGCWSPTTSRTWTPGRWPCGSTSPARWRPPLVLIIAGCGMLDRDRLGAPALPRRDRHAAAGRHPRRRLVRRPRRLRHGHRLRHPRRPRRLLRAARGRVGDGLNLPSRRAPCAERRDGDCTALRGRRLTGRGAMPRLIRSSTAGRPSSCRSAGRGWGRVRSTSRRRGRISGRRRAARR